jgi:hypothetical protein
VTVYNKNLSNQCNLLAQINQVQDRMIYKPKKHDIFCEYQFLGFKNPYIN